MSTGELKLIWSVWKRWELNLFFLCSGSVESIRKVGGNHFLCACSSFPLPHIPLTTFLCLLQEITSKLNRLQTQLYSFIKKCPEQLEQFIFDNSKQIHDNHFVMVEAKYMLCLMYGNIAGYHYKGLTS